LNPHADTLEAIVAGNADGAHKRAPGRLIDSDEKSLNEKKKKEGYF